MSWADLFGYFTGLGFLAPHMDPATLLRTVLLAHFLDAIVCRVIAHNSGYPKNLSMVLGMLFGVWAVAVLILLPYRQSRRRAGVNQESQ
jgi:hypothetical protein